MNVLHLHLLLLLHFSFSSPRTSSAAAAFASSHRRTDPGRAAAARAPPPNMSPSTTRDGGDDDDAGPHYDRHSNRDRGDRDDGDGDHGGGGGGRDVVRWAIVGLGDVCAVKSGPAFYKCRGSTLSAVMRRTPGAARDWIETHRDLMPRDVAANVRAFDSVERMMEEVEVDAVYVASPPGAHLANVREIAAGCDRNRRANGRNRLRAVYVEKPCGRCAWETRVMADELRARDVAFYPAYVSRAHERTGTVRRLLGEGRKVCGERVTSVTYVQRGSGPARGLDAAVPWRLDAARSGGGLIMDMGCHVLDRLDYLLGPLEGVKSVAARKGSGPSYPSVEDYASMSATIGECDWCAVPSAGAAVECVWDFSPAGEGEEDVDELVIAGPGGSLRMAAMGAGLPIRVLDADGRPVETIEFDAPAHAAQPLIQSVVDELLGDGDGAAEGDRRSVRSPARVDNAVRTSEVLDAILGSYYAGRHDEFWTRPETWTGLKSPSS